jgi:4-alpha-glucanotransferase
MGDLPFMVGRDSADVWAERHEFRDDASVGVPPDLFDAEGQDWDLPPYDWDRMKMGGYAWLRRRARYVGSLYDRFRIDHLVGFYRTYSRPRDGRRDAKGKLVAGTFDPDEQSAQLAHGERVVGAMIEGAREERAQLVAEDLGVVPDFVRASLTRLGVPGYRVLIWEKDGAVFCDPAAYPRVSVACFGTHDTAPVAAWWETLGDAERQAVLALPGLSERAAGLTPTFTEPVHRALVDLLSRAASELVLFLIQDVLGSKERINTPATVGAHNWGYRLPRAVEDLRGDAASAARMRWFSESVRASGRG